MNIYIYLDDNDFEGSPQSIYEALTQWVTDEYTFAESVKEIDGCVKTGIHFSATKKVHLKEPLKFLNTLSKTHKCNFVVGFFDEQTQQPEDVCYFGHDEGKPDPFEIATYLGL